MLKTFSHIFSEKGNLFSKVYSTMAQSLSDMVYKNTNISLNFQDISKIPFVTISQFK